MANRFENKVRVLDLIRARGQVSRPVLSEVLAINLPTISSLTKELLDERLIHAEGFDKSDGGRRPELLALNPGFSTAMGLELSLSGIRGVLTDLSGKVLDREEGPKKAPAEPEEMIDAVLAVAESLLARSGERRPVGVGLGLAGLSDETGRVWRYFPHRKTWRDVALAERLEQRLGIPARLENDVQAATLAELRYGQARGLRDVLYLHIGHGIACGIVVDGKLYTGATRNAGEFGHTILEPSGPICYCGNYGCLESLAAPAAMVEQAGQALRKGVLSSAGLRLAEGQTLTPGALLRAADDGDRLAENVVLKAAEYIGLGLANLVNFFNPHGVIFGGEILVRGHRVLNEGIERTFRQRVLPVRQAHTPVLPSSLGRDATALGGAMVVFEELFERPEALFALAHGQPPLVESSPARREEVAGGRRR
ncbi:MAG: ROK family protein [Planctomycetota bacterium]|nr:ROK family protein [Planctomycetota bacterium]